MKKRIKIDGILIFCIFWLLVIFKDVFLRDKQASALPEIIMLSSGIVFFLTGQIIRISARGLKSEYSQNGALLIQNGPYSLVRNPMYLGVLLITAGVALILLNLWSAGVFVLLFLLRYLWVIRQEEEKLAVVFDEQYYNYRAKVPRILPSLHSLFKKDTREYLPVKKAWVKKEFGAIITLLLVILFLKCYR